MPRPGAGRGSGHGNGGSLPLPSLLYALLGTPISFYHCPSSKPWDAREAARATGEDSMIGMRSFLSPNCLLLCNSESQKIELGGGGSRQEAFKLFAGGAVDEVS
ncbi:hypothetical protein BAE44_0005207 [Dichanthelium oligosanthes]|uniref:Uncharacterized protein n=1 Tax=Dichanthelium oligosanthes TaxID=888268 RepID=A0A1E5W8S4_9POAL|nr:hypothetical protein BAE44_0005207 [Dichanthelium oligosanthes]